MMKTPEPRTKRGWQMAAIHFLALAVMLAAAACGGRVATRAPDTRTAVVLSTTTPTAPAAAAQVTVPAAASTVAPAIAAAAPASLPEIQKLSAQAGWTVLTAQRLPEGYHFESAYFDASHQMASLTYLVTRPLPGAKDPALTASKTITLLQAQKNDFIPMQVGPGAKMAALQVNGEPATYGIGAWDAEFVPDAKDPNGGKMAYTWRNDLTVQNLFWRVGATYLALITDDETLSQDALAAMAGSTAP